MVGGIVKHIRCHCARGEDGRGFDIDFAVPEAISRTDIEPCDARRERRTGINAVYIGDVAAITENDIFGRPATIGAGTAGKCARFKLQAACNLDAPAR